MKCDFSSAFLGKQVIKSEGGGYEGENMRKRT